ncbi:MAG: hypothetical protein PUE01_09095 [Clostridiaceae bacterium]|nr:hypothetical protein [Clostridiaceae bacterium]
MKKIMSILLYVCLLCLPLIACSGEKPKELTDEDIANYSSNMSDDIYSGDITINGVKHTLPVKISEMNDSNFNIDSVYKKHQQIDSKKAYQPVSMDYPNASGKTSIRISFMNKTSKPIDIEDCEIYEMDFYGVNDNYINTIVLPKGITIKSTYNDILNTYGKPTTDYIAVGAANRIDYEDPENPLGGKLSFEFESDNNTIKNIIVKH